MMMMMMMMMIFHRSIAGVVYHMYRAK